MSGDEAKKKPKLTDKQEAFCREYLTDLNATQAAIRAGYKENSARQQAATTLSKDYIQDRIAELNAERVKRTQIDADYVLTSLKRVADRCMQDEPVYAFEDGEKVPTGEYKFEHSGANKALELLGRHLKLFTDRIDHGVQEGIAFNMNFGSKEQQS